MNTLFYIYSGEKHHPLIRVILNSNALPAQTTFSQAAPPRPDLKGSHSHLHIRSWWLPHYGPRPLLRPSAPTPALPPSHSARHCYPVQSVLLWPEVQTVCFQQNTPAQTSSWESWREWVVNNHMICWGAPNDYQQSRILSWDTAEEDGRTCSFWPLQRTEVPVQIGRWGFKYSFQSKFTSTMCHDEKDRKLNQNHNLLIKWVSGPNPDRNHQEIKNLGGKFIFRKNGTHGRRGWGNSIWSPDINLYQFSILTLY